MTITKSNLVRLNARLAQFFTWGDQPRADIVQDLRGVRDDRFSVSYVGFYWVLPASGVDAIHGMMSERSPKSPIDIRQTADAFLETLDRLEAQLA